jgi:DnaJ-class molecular chaperone
MHHIYSATILTASDVSCSKCDWKGTGKDMKQEELFLTDAIELYCPSCNGYLGFISEPDKTSREN